jgi:hypothetical protein
MLLGGGAVGRSRGRLAETSTGSTILQGI